MRSLLGCENLVGRQRPKLLCNIPFNNFHVMPHEDARAVPELLRHVSGILAMREHHRGRGVPQNVLRPILQSEHRPESFDTPDARRSRQSPEVRAVFLRVFHPCDRHVVWEAKVVIGSTVIG